jgi:hypothetical protein
MAGSATRKLLVRLRRRSLDRRLATGEDPLGDELLIERAAQIARPEARVDLARMLERAIVDVDRPPRCSNAVPVCRCEVIRALPTLLRLIERLRDGAPAWPAGLAAVRELLADGGGPLYVQRRPGALRRRARAALRELDPDLAAEPPGLPAR